MTPTRRGQTDLISDGVRAADVELGEEDLARLDQIMAGAATVGEPSPERV